MLKVCECMVMYPRTCPPLHRGPSVLPVGRLQICLGALLWVHLYPPATPGSPWFPGGGQKWLSSTLGRQPSAYVQPGLWLCPPTPTSRRPEVGARGRLRLAWSSWLIFPGLHRSSSFS